MKKDPETGLLKAYKECLDSARVHEKNLRNIVETGHSMEGSKDIGDIMESMLELAVKITGAEYACAALMGRNDDVFFSRNVPAKDPDKFPIDRAFSREEGLSGLLMRTKTSYVCNIAEGDKYLDDDTRTDFGVKNYISVPILAKNMNFSGLIEVYNKNCCEPFNDSDMDMLSTIASFTSAAVERFRIYVEFGKFGGEVEKIVDEALSAESAFLKEADMREKEKKENEKLKRNLEKARTLAREIMALEE